MNRNESKALVIIASLIGLLLHTTKADAQLSNFIASTAGGVFLGGEQHNESIASSNNTNFALLTLTGDWDFQMPRQAGVTQSPSTGAMLQFIVGNLPVEIYTLNVYSNAKWVNGGGDDTSDPSIPQTDWTITAALHEQLQNSPDPSTDPLLTASIDNGSSNGNGYGVFTHQSPYAPTVILGAGLTYYLFLDNATTISIGNDWSDTTPTVVVTNEFGGTYGDTFTGFSASFYWVTVPEPSTLTLLAIGALGLTALRRFASPGIRS